MAQLVVRGIEQRLKDRLKRRAARRGRSMEEEVRDILRDATRLEDAPSAGIGTRAASLFRGIGLKAPIRELRGRKVKPLRFN